MKCYVVISYGLGTAAIVLAKVKPSIILKTLNLSAHLSAKLLARLLVHRVGLLVSCIYAGRLLTLAELRLSFSIVMHL